MATPEGKVKKWLDDMLKAEPGVWFFSPQAGPYGGSGVHDRVGCAYGLFFSIECKANVKGKMTALQELRQEQVEAAGGKFFLVYDKATIETVRQWIVDTRNRRPKSGCSSLGTEGRHLICDTDGKVRAVYTDPIFGAPHFRDDASPEELRRRSSFPNPPLL